MSSGPMLKRQFAASLVFAVGAVSAQLPVLPEAAKVLTSEGYQGTNRYACAANTGWVDLSPPAGVKFGATCLAGRAYDANCGWIDFGDGTPADGQRYGNVSADDYGVNHDGAGNLSGYAYGANVGWINFGWADPADPNRPRLDLATGHFSGSAYGANVGWIELRFARLAHTLAFDLGGHAARTDGGSLTQTVYHAEGGSAPALAAYPGWTFTGWSAAFGSLTGNTVVVAQYERVVCAVTFDLGAYGTRTGGGTLAQQVVYGEAAAEPTVAVAPQWRLSGWRLEPGGADLGCVVAAVTAVAQYAAVHRISGGGAFAYSANAGWVNFAPAADEGVAFGEHYLSGYAHAANVGWLHFGDGQPANGIRYGNGSAGDYGVNHDGGGNLSGYAYGANVGWVNFGWADAAEPDRPRVDLATGAFGGYAYGANIGWLNLGAGLRTLGMFSLDFDGDGLGDAWEREWFGNLTTANGGSNADGDAATDLDEYRSGSDPEDPEAFLAITAITFEAGWTQAQVSFSSAPGRLYRIEFCEALGGEWQDAGPGVFAPDAGASSTRLVTWPGSASRFIRVVALLPLQPE